MVCKEKDSPQTVIHRLRTEKGLTQAALARRAGMTPSQLCKLELGQNAMTESTMRRIAKALDISIAELLGENVTTGFEVRENPDSTIYQIEKYSLVCRGNMSDELIGDLRRIVREKEAEITEAEKTLGIVPGTALQLFFPYGVNEEAAELLARDMRFSLGVGNMPLQNLASLLEMRGVRIFKVEETNSFQSLSFFNTSLHTLAIVLNARNTDERNTYRLAYELGAASVFAMSSFRTVGDEGNVHRLLRKFTAAFLMPEETMRMDVARCGIEPNKWSMRLLNLLKRRFAVSAEAYALRLETLGLITPSLRVQLRDELRQYYIDHPDAMEPSPDSRESYETRLVILSEAVSVAKHQERER